MPVPATSGTYRYRGRPAQPSKDELQHKIDFAVRVLTSARKAKTHPECRGLVEAVLEILEDPTRRQAQSNERAADG